MCKFMKSKLATYHSCLCEHLLYTKAVLQRLLSYNLSQETYMKNINYKLVAVEM